MHNFVEAFLNAHVLAQSAPDLLLGLGTTIELAACIVATGLLTGFALTLARLLAPKALRWLIVQIVDLLRALPPLVILVLIYFGLPDAPSGFAATWITLSLVLMAFAEEIFWAGIASVPRGQWEAARSLGLGFARTLRTIILPQALRISLPPLTNRTIAITKGTALGSVVAVHEVLGAASSAVSNTYNPSPLLLGAGLYLLLFLPVVIAARRLEARA